MNSYVALRGSIYVSLASITAFSGWINDLTPESILQLNWAEWAGMAVSVVTAGLLALRAYIDGSNERSKQALKDFEIAISKPL